MISGNEHSSFNLFASAFVYYTKSKMLELAENFAQVFPVPSGPSLTLANFIAFSPKPFHEPLEDYIINKPAGSQFIFTIQVPETEGQKFQPCSCWLRIEKKNAEKIEFCALNISIFLPGNSLFSNLDQLIKDLENIRKITHDLNNQFQIIAGYGSSLYDEIDDPDHKECAQCIVDAVKNAISHNQSLRKLFPPKNMPQKFVPEALRNTDASEVASTSAKADPEKNAKGIAEIMVVDDEPLVQKFLCDMLRRLKYTPHGYTSGKTALEAAINGKAKFDLAILDMNLPDISTEELFTHFRNHMPKTRIILISGENQNDSSLRMLDQGAGAYLQKPTSVKVLAETISRVIGG